MAVANTQTFELVPECPICRQRLIEPHAFHCLHFFCRPCIDKMEPTKMDDSVAGYACPACNEITPKENVRSMRMVQDLQEVFTSAKKEHLVCCKCASEVPTHRCEDCGENYCQPCRDIHNEFPFLKHHKWVELSERGRVVVDKRTYCFSHPRELIKLNCKDCNQLICILCNGIEHKHHEAESIEDALKQALPVVKENKEIVENVIRENKKVLAKMEACKEALAEEYDVIENEVDAHCNKVISKVREDTRLVKQELTQVKTKQLDDLDGLIRQTELKLACEKNTVAICNATLSSVKGTSLLQVLQSEVGASLAEFRGESVEFDEYFGKTKARFVGVRHNQSNLVGSICSTTGRSMWIPKPLTTMPNNLTLIKESAPGYSCRRFSKIGEELWCVQENSQTIHIHTMDGTEVRTMQLRNATNIRAVLQYRSHIIVSTTQGLFLADMNGANMKNILTGDFSDVSVMRNYLFALDDGAGKVRVLKQDTKSNTFTQQLEFIIANYTKNMANTIQVTLASIYIADFSKNVILQYNHDGVLVASHCAKDTAIGTLGSPYLCGADAEDTLLIADYGRHRMVTLQASGEWRAMQLNGLNYPTCAIVDGERLIVMYHANKIMQYSIP